MFAEFKASDFQKIREKLRESGIAFQTSSASFTDEKVQYLHLEFGDNLTKKEMSILKAIFSEIIEQKDTFKNSVLAKENATPITDPVTPERKEKDFFSNILGEEDETNVKIL